MKKIIIAGITSAILFTTNISFAHTPLCSCFNEGDGTVFCEGGFSNGSSAEGVTMIVKDKKGKKLISGQMDEYSEFSFKKPSVPFNVFFDAGEGHTKKIEDKDIE